MKAAYVPERGHIVWINFSPQTGHEQAGRRPALVLSGKPFNRTGFLVACPVTSKRKNGPFEVPVVLSGTKGSVLFDHVRSLDWRKRQMQYMGTAPEELVRRVQKLVVSLIIN